jgi:polyferredoxin
MNKQLLKGAVIGIIAPIAAFVVYVAFFTKNAEPIEMFNQLVAMNKLAHAMSLSVLINLLIFFMNIKTYRDEAARGILLATILYGITIAIIKFS